MGRPVQKMQPVAGEGQLVSDGFVAMAAKLTAAFAQMGVAAEAAAAALAGVGHAMSGASEPSVSDEALAELLKAQYERNLEASRWCGVDNLVERDGPGPSPEDAQQEAQPRRAISLDGKIGLTE